MKNKKKNKGGLLPSLNSFAYSKLSFSEQVRILNLFLNDPNAYKELTGVSPSHINDEYSYINEEIRDLHDRFCTPIPSKSDVWYPMTFIRNWAVYLTTYNEKNYNPNYNPLDTLGFSHRKMLGLHLFDFPFLVCDDIMRGSIGWLHENKFRHIEDALFFAASMRTAAEYFHEGEYSIYSDDSYFADLWNTSRTKLYSFTSFEDLCGTYPLIPYSDELVELIEDGTLVIYFTQFLYLNGLYFAPIVPSELYESQRFSIKGWGFVGAS